MLLFHFISLHLHLRFLPPGLHRAENDAHAKLSLRVWPNFSFTQTYSTVWSGRNAAAGIRASPSSSSSFILFSRGSLVWGRGQLMRFIGLNWSVTQWLILAHSAPNVSSCLHFCGPAVDEDEGEKNFESPRRETRCWEACTSVLARVAWIIPETQCAFRVAEPAKWRRWIFAFFEWWCEF